MSNFAEKLKQSREAKGLSQQNIADILGVTQGAISNWENRDSSLPDASKLAPLAQALEVSLDWLFSANDLSSKLKDNRPMQLVNKLSCALDADQLTKNQISILSAIIDDFIKNGNVNSNS